MKLKNVITLISIDMYFEHFTVSELFTHCSDSEVVECVRTKCIDHLLKLTQFLDGFRDYAETPIVINSSYRDPEHNKSVKGVSTSQHMLGQAIDFHTPKMPHSTAVYFLKKYIEKSPLSSFLGQVIIYNNFFHIGLRTQSHPKLIYYDKRNGKNNY